MNIIVLINRITVHTVLLYCALCSCNAISVRQSYNRTNAVSLIDPCNDFYQYACSDWKNNHAVPEGELSITSILQIQNNTLHDIWKIIANGSYSTNDTRLTTVRKFYKSCVDHGNRTLQQTRRQAIHLIRKSFGGWDLLPSSSQHLSETVTPEQEVDDFSLNDIYYPSLSITGGCPLFSIDISVENLEIQISDGKFASYKDACETEVDAANIAPKYYEYAYKLGVSPTEKSKLKAAFELHTRLCRNLYFSKKSDLTDYHKEVTMNELKSICPLMDWDQLFAKLFRQIGFEHYRSFSISIADTTALQHQCALHEIELSTPTGKSTIQNMAIMDFMAYQANTIDFEVESSESANAEMDSQLRPKFSAFCIKRLRDIFPWTLERHYVAQYLKESQRNEVLNMVDEIKKTLNDSIEELAWLSDEMKRFATDKISKIKTFALFDGMETYEEKENLSTIYRLQDRIRENKYIVNEYYALKAKVLDTYRKPLFGLQEKLDSERLTYIPTASYSPTENRISINGAILNLPIYHDNQTIYEKYGGLGWHIAHELLHAVDTSGILVDENGSQRPYSTSHHEFLTILKQTECLRKQYKNYNYTSEKSATIGSQDEILSDNGGLRIAYKTLQRLTRNFTNGADENTNSSLTSEQSFFHNFAQIFCEKYNADGLIKHTSNVDHVLGHYRVIGALSNSENFARAYNCPLDSPMNPSEKCQVW
uniref:Peptidase_M13 domain-containing protein n=1 Tax=Trichobilharzia regenti TaxID=157069 RepID=A0AA85K133_TRIRE|nr:unnamed protein product [Trichobilharzia regenti]